MKSIKEIAIEIVDFTSQSPLYPIYQVREVEKISDVNNIQTYLFIYATPFSGVRAIYLWLTLSPFELNMDICLCQVKAHPTVFP